MITIALFIAYLEEKKEGVANTLTISQNEDLLQSSINFVFNTYLPFKVIAM